MKVLLVGNPLDGYGLYGPFEDNDAAYHWAESVNLDDDWVAGTLNEVPNQKETTPADAAPTDLELGFSVILDALLKTHVINWEQIAHNTGLLEDELMEFFESAGKLAHVGHEQPVEVQQTEAIPWADLWTGGGITIAPATAEGTLGWGMLDNSVAGNVPANDTTGKTLPNGLTDNMPGMIAANIQFEGYVGKEAKIIFDEIADKLDGIETNIEELAALKKLEKVVAEPEDSVPTEG